jgi:hypothetical protein
MGGAALLAVGSALILLGRFGGELTGASSSDLGWKQWTVLLVGIALLVAGAWLAAPPRDESAGRLRPILPVAVAGIGLLLIWWLLVALDQSLWHDEAFSALVYTSHGPSEILFGDYLPNDHVLFNLLTWATTSVVGESEIAYRLWSTLPALAAVALIVWWSWRRLDPWTASVALLLAATSPLLLVLARQARGYGLAMLAGASMLVFADRLARDFERRDLAGFGVAGWVGIATLPAFAISFVGQALPFLLSGLQRIRVAIAVFAVGAAALIFYAPMLADVIDSAGQEFGRRLPWHGPLSTAATDVLGPSAQIVARPDQPPALPDARVAGDNAVAGALALAGAVLLWRRREPMLTALLVAPPVFTYLVLTLGGLRVEPRFSSFLLFHLLVLAAAGVVGLVRAIPARWPRRIAAAIAGAAAVLALVHSVQLGDEIHALPNEDFKRVAELTGESRVLTDSVRPEGLQFYLGVDNVIPLPPEELVQRFCDSGRGFVYVDHPYRPTIEAPPPDVTCLRQRGAERVRVPQRERGGWIDVWNVPAR